MIDNLTIVPKPKFRNLAHGSVEAYMNKMPKASRLYIQSASHGEGFDKTQPFHALSNSLMYYAFSIVNRNTFNEALVAKILETCSYVDFKYGLVLLLSLHEKLGSKKVQQHVEQYLVELSTERKDTADNLDVDIETLQMRMAIFLNRLSIFLTIFTLEHIHVNKTQFNGNA